MNVMLLAAGEGTRLRPYTQILPKPAIPFLTVPLAAHALGFIHGSFTINNLVVNTFYLPKKIHELFHRLPHKSKNLYFSDEVGQILGSGGGLRQAQAHFKDGGDFVMMNADEIILPHDSAILQKALEQHKKNKALATLLVMDHPGVGAQFGGVWTNANHQVFGFGKEAIPKTTKAWHFVGVQILSEKVFDYIPQEGEANILYDALTKGIQDGELVQAFPFDCAWFETGNPQDFLNAARQCMSLITSPQDTFQKKALMTTLGNFASKDIRIATDERAQKIISANARIDDSVKISGMFCAGANSIVAPACHLENVIVGDGVHVPAGTNATNSIFL